MSLLQQRLDLLQVHALRPRRQIIKVSSLPGHEPTRRRTICLLLLSPLSLHRLRRRTICLLFLSPLSWAHEVRGLMPC